MFLMVSIEEVETLKKRVEALEQIATAILKTCQGLSATLGNLEVQLGQNAAAVTTMAEKVAGLAEGFDKRLEILESAVYND